MSTQPHEPHSTCTDGERAHYRAGYQAGCLGMLDPFAQGLTDLATVIADHPDWTREEVVEAIRVAGLSLPGVIRALVAANMQAKEMRG